MIKNLFLFTGQETYLLHEQIKAWKKAFLEKHGDLNLDHLEATQVPLNEVGASIQAIPFLGEKRLIFIEGLPEAPKTRNADKVSKKDEKREIELRKFEETLKDVPETSIVVFIQSNPDKRKAFYKHLVKSAEVKEFKLLEGFALTQWIQKRVQEKGSTISPSAAEYLGGVTAHNLWRLSTEIDKLVTHSLGVDLSRELIDSLVTPTIEVNIFQLTDALAAKNKAKALDCLARTIKSGENLQPVFYMIIRQFRLLLQGRAFFDQDHNPSPATFGARLKLHPFVAKNTLSQAKHFQIPQLKTAYQNLLKIDTGLKTSHIKVLADDQSELALALERFILKFCD